MRKTLYGLFFCLLVPSLWSCAKSSGGQDSTEAEVKAGGKETTAPANPSQAGDAPRPGEGARAAPALPQAAPSVTATGEPRPTAEGEPPAGGGSLEAAVKEAEAVLGSSAPPPTASPPAPQADAPPPLPAKWASHAKGLPFVLGYARGLEIARAKKKPIMFFVTTTWCGWCRRLASDSFTDAGIRNLLKENFVLVIVDGDTERAAARKLGTRGFPHVVFQSADGRTLAVSRGYKPKAQFRAVVEQALRNAKALSP